MSRFLAVSVLLACSSQAFAQSQTVVKLTVAATESKGAPVTDLRAADIQIREDGKLQPLVFFRFAGSNRQMAQAAPDEFINRPAPLPTLILLDRWNEQEMTMAAAWQDVEAAVGHLENVERLYIYFLDNHATLVPVRPLPGAETDLHVPEALPPALLVRRLNEKVRSLSGLRDMTNIDPTERADKTLRALSIVSRMASLPGPKNLIWVTHGFPIEMLNMSGERIDYTSAVLNLAQTAAHAQVAIYAVDQSAQGAGADVAGLSRQMLELLAAQTGGRWYSSGRTSDALAGAAADARGSYQIAYLSPVDVKRTKDPKLRIDSVRKGTHLLTRPGLTGDEATPDPQEVIEDVFTAQSHSPFEATEIALRVKRTKAPQAIHLDIRIGDIYLEHRGERYRGDFSLKLALYRDGGFESSPATIRQKLDLSQEQYDTAMKSGITIPLDVAVTDQIQQVRVMVFDFEIHGLGSVTVPVK